MNERVEMLNDRQRQMHQQVEQVQGNQAHLQSGVEHAFSAVGNQFNNVRQHQHERSSGSQENPDRHRRNQYSPIPPSRMPASTTTGNAFPSFLSPVKPPPSFDINNYANWKEEVCFWKEAQAHIKEQLVAEMDLASTKLYRPVMMRFMRDTATAMDRRTIKMC